MILSPGIEIASTSVRHFDNHLIDELRAPKIQHCGGKILRV
jgi:hypothetical protein